MLAALLLSITATEADVRWLGRVVRCAAAIEAALILAEFAGQQDLVYRSQFAGVASLRYASVVGFRPHGTFDHPLIAGAFLLLAGCLTPLPVAGRRVSRFVAEFLLLELALFATGARTDLVLSVAVVVYRSLRAHGRGRTTVLVTVVTALGAATAIGAASGALGVVADRFADDRGSTQVRATGYAYFLSHATAHVWSGVGVGNSFLISRGLFGTATSFENAVVMVSFDTGLMSALILGAGLLGMLARPVTRPAEAGRLVTAVAVISAYAGFSSFAVRGTSGYFLWLGVALIAFRRAPEPPERQRRSPVRARADDRAGSQLLGAVP